MERGSVSWGHGVTRPALLQTMRRKLQSIYLEMYMRKVCHRITWSEIGNLACIRETHFKHNSQPHLA